MIEKLSQRTAIAIAAVGLVAVILVGWFAVVSPQRSKAAELQGKIDESRSALQLAESLNGGGQKKATAKEARALVRAMPDQARMSQILRQLSWAAKSTRVRVNSVTPSATAPLTGYEAIPMTVVVEGRYLGITNFVGLLRSQVRASAEKVRAKGRLYSVDQIQFDSNSDKSLVQATMTLNAYKFGGAAAPATASADTAATTTATAPRRFRGASSSVRRVGGRRGSARPSCSLRFRRRTVEPRRCVSPAPRAPTAFAAPPFSGLRLGTGSARATGSSTAACTATSAGVERAAAHVHARGYRTAYIRQLVRY